jgi:crossover junction endodeoxyribonuclease RuvC
MGSDNPRILGIDPGLTGGLALWKFHKIERAWNMPTYAVTKGRKTRKHLDLDKITIQIAFAEIDFAIIEAQQAYKGQGVSTTFTTGKNYGALLGLLHGLEIATKIVTAQAWKKALSLGKDKQLSFDLATKLFPDASHFWLRKKDDGVAEAALLAHYGASI